MSSINGDRARFHKDRKRKLRHRQSIRSLATRLDQQKATTQPERPALQLAIPQPERTPQARPHSTGDEDSSRIRS